MDKEREENRTGAPQGADARPRRNASAPTQPAALPAQPRQPAGEDAAGTRKPGPARPKPAPKSPPRKAAGEARQPRETPPADPRAAALALLSGLREGRSLDDQLESPAFAALAPAERARAQRLSAATLRHRSRADAVLAPLLQRQPRPVIADLLTLAVTEMLALGAAPHGVVSEAVALARRQGQKGAAAAGMVNAVLRRAAEAQAAWDAAPPPRLPNWLRGPVAAQWGEAAATAIEAAHEAGAPIDLTLKPGAPTPEGEALPTGSVRLPAGAQVSALPGFAAGDWWVQDAAAALPARLLAPQPGEAIADLCAAPGGKTLQLAAAGARVTAIDISAPRLERLRQNLARCGLEAEVVTADALDWQPDTPPDAILIDAPCSATGTIRRHPELPLIRDGSGIAALTALQAALIDRAVALLPPGGRLLFATCSLLAAEGEDQVRAALTRHPGLSVEPPDAATLDVDPGWITPEGGLRLRPDLWPDRGGMDGFYMARLRVAGG